MGDRARLKGVFALWKKADTSEADAAIEESKNALLEARERTGRTLEVKEAFDRIREQNHFADQVHAIISAAGKR